MEIVLQIKFRRDFADLCQNFAFLDQTKGSTDVNKTDVKFQVNFNFLKVHVYAISTPNLAAQSITSQEIARGMFAPQRK